MSLPEYGLSRTIVFVISMKVHNSNRAGVSLDSFPTPILATFSDSIIDWLKQLTQVLHPESPCLQSHVLFLNKMTAMWNILTVFMLFSKVNVY